MSKSATPSNLIKMETLSLFYGLIDIRYPSFLADLDFRVKIPLLAEDFSVSVPKILFKTLFYLGLASSIYYLYRLIGRGKTFVWQYIKSLFNSKKYL